ncbi:MAG: hypothetical protein GX299_08520 [Epulopiscium sp.]|nr:hypothetical protein [Candidatus Epulonipiscium sp.]
MTKINYHSVKEFGDHDTIGYLEDDRVFWTWNLGRGMAPEKLLEMGAKNGEDGGIVFPTIEEIINYIRSGERHDLADEVEKEFIEFI